MARWNGKGLSPEEKEQRKEALRQQVEEVVNNFETSPETILNYLKFSSRFHQYSVNNTILIYEQNSMAHFCASYKAFQDMGYQVQKGEVGMKIFVPYISTFWFDEASEQWNRLADASKEIKEKIRAGEIQTKQHTTFGIGTVFDIGQTDCPPEDYPKVCDMGFASESHARLFNALVHYAESRNISVNIKSLPSITTRGYYNRGDNSITISDKLNDSMKLSVMSHELAHAIMHGSEDAAELSTFQKEIEADSLSLMFRQHLGITEIEDVRQKHLQDSYKQYIDLANSSNSGEYQSLSEILDNVNKAYLSIVDDFNSSINNYLNLEKENRISEGRLTTGLQLPFVSSNTNSIDIINDGAEKVNTVQVKAVEAFSNKIDDFLEGKLKPREQIFVCKTTNAMKMCGANELNVVINQKTVEKIIDTGWAMSSHNSHSLSIEVLKEMPAQLENPIMIFEGSHKGSIVAVTELFNDKQEQIVISCELDSGSKWNKINRITSMYGKGNIRAYLRNQIEDNKLLGCNKIIANKTLQSLGLQLPQEETFIDYSSAVKQISSIEKAQLPTTITNADRNVIANEMFETPGLRLPRGGTSIEKNNEVNKMLHSTIHNSNGLAGLQLPGENTSIDYTISITDNSKNVNREFDSDIGVNMKKTIVVNLFAGPGAGKTTCAWEIASELKKRGIETEYVSEYAKELVWDNNLEMLDGSLEHQRMLYNEQERRVQRLLGKVDVVVTDSPAILSHFYLKEANAAFTDEMLNNFKNQQNFNLLIQRGKVFHQQGRLQNLEESKEIDNRIANFLKDNDIYYGTYNHSTIGILVQNIIKNIDTVNSNLKGQSMKKELPELTTEPYIVCEWSEHSDFKDGKRYELAEFDRLMKEADENWVFERAAEIERNGSFDNAIKNDDYLHQGYAKTKFTLYMPDGTSITERQDIGDGEGGVIDFLRQFPKYEAVVAQLDKFITSASTERSTSPFISEYFKLQNEYPDNILFSKLGDFYEVMGDNAKVAAEELDLVLTGRTINSDTGERIAMCGVPAHTVESYVSRLVDKGYSVSLAESGEVKRVLLPGTQTTEAKKRIFVDMDGTLAEWNYVETERLYEEGYYRNLEPNQRLLDDVKSLIANGENVYVLSAYLTDSEYALQEKQEWLQEHLPELPSERQIFVPYGTNKAEFLKDNYSPITQKDYLVDDYTKNLNEWQEYGGIGVKYLNGINHTKGTWQGLMVAYDKVKPSLSDVISGEELRILDKKAISEYLENEEELPVDILCDESKLQWVSFSCSINDVEKTKDLLEALQNEEKQVVSIQNIDNGCRLVHIDSEMNITPVNNMVFMSPEGAMKEIYSNSHIAKAVDYDSMLQAADEKRLTALSKANNEKFPYVKVNWSDNSELSSHGYLNYNMANNLSRSLNENNQQEGKIEKTNLTLFLDGNTSIQLDMSLGDESGGLTEHLNQLLQENSISSEASLQSLKSFLKERGLLYEGEAISSEISSQLQWEDTMFEL